MREIWLNSNRRPLVVSLLANVLALVTGVTLIALGWALNHPLGLGVPGVLFAALGGWFLIAHARQWAIPRMARENNELLLFLGNRDPDRVPLEQVECFFLGQGPTALPAAMTGPAGGDVETVTIVVRLAEAAKDWHHRETRRELAHWCDGYITLRGTWCEPITGELVKALNHRLVEAHRQIRFGNPRN